jgi:fermentation-respiration switch protein FrsA (DUF1100 family)
MKRFLLITLIVVGGCIGTMAMTDQAEARPRASYGRYYAPRYNYAPQRYYRYYATPRYYSRGYYTPYRNYYRGYRGYPGYYGQGGVYIGGPRGGVNIRW